MRTTNEIYNEIERVRDLLAEAYLLQSDPDPITLITKASESLKLLRAKIEHLLAAQVT